jgi:hypothetical protein
VRRLIEEAGFDLERVSYCNTMLFLPVLAMRKAKNLLRSLRQARRDGHDPLRSDLDEYAAPVNAALYWLMRGETRLMRRVDLPFGVSILAVARRPVVPEPAVRVAAQPGAAWATAPVALRRTAVGAADRRGALATAPVDVGEEVAVP